MCRPEVKLMNNFGFIYVIDIFVEVTESWFYMFQLQLDEVLVDDAPFDIVSCQVNYDYHLNFQNLMRSCVVAWCWNQHLLKQLPNIHFFTEPRAIHDSTMPT